MILITSTSSSSSSSLSLLLLSVGRELILGNVICRSIASNLSCRVRHNWRSAHESMILPLERGWCRRKVLIEGHSPRCRVKSFLVNSSERKAIEMSESARSPTLLINPTSSTTRDESESRKTFRLICFSCRWDEKSSPSRRVIARGASCRFWKM